MGIVQGERQMDTRLLDEAEALKAQLIKHIERVGDTDEKLRRLIPKFTDSNDFYRRLQSDAFTRKRFGWSLAKFEALPWIVVQAHLDIEIADAPAMKSDPGDARRATDKTSRCRRSTCSSRRESGSLQKKQRARRAGRCRGNEDRSIDIPLWRSAATTGKRLSPATKSAIDDFIETNFLLNRIARNRTNSD